MRLDALGGLGELLLDGDGGRPFAARLHRIDDLLLLLGQLVLAQFGQAFDLVDELGPAQQDELALVLAGQRLDDLAGDPLGAAGHEQHVIGAEVQAGLLFDGFFREEPEGASAVPGPDFDRSAGSAELLDEDLGAGGGFRSRCDVHDADAGVRDFALDGFREPGDGAMRRVDWRLPRESEVPAERGGDAERLDGLVAGKKRFHEVEGAADQAVAFLGKEAGSGHRVGKEEDDAVDGTVLCPGGDAFVGLVEGLGQRVHGLDARARGRQRVGGRLVGAGCVEEDPLVLDGLGVGFVGVSQGRVPDDVSRGGRGVGPLGRRRVRRRRGCRDGLGGRRCGFRCGAVSVAVFDDELGHAVQGRVIADLDSFDGWDAEPFAHLAEDLCLLHRVDSEVGLEVEVRFQQVGGISGLLRDERRDGLERLCLLGRHGCPVAACLRCRGRFGRRRFRGGRFLGFRLRGGRRFGCGRRLGPTEACRDVVDDPVDGGVVLELQPLFLREAVVFAQFAEQFGLLDGIDAEVGLEVEVRLEHVLGVAGLLGEEVEQSVQDLLAVRVAGDCTRGRLGRCRHGARRGFRFRRRRRGRRFRFRARCPFRCRRRRGGRAARETALDVFDDAVNRRVVLELQSFLLWKAVVFAQLTEQFGLLDRVDAEVGLQVEVRLQHVLRVPGLLGKQVEQTLSDLVD